MNFTRAGSRKVAFFADAEITALAEIEKIARLRMIDAIWGDPNQNTRTSSRFVEDGSYVRLKNLVLGYTLPASLAGPPSSSGLKGSMPSTQPASTTCGHSRPLEACSVESVTTFWSFSRSLMVDSSAMVCATSSRLLRSLGIATPWPLAKHTPRLFCAA